MSDNAVLERIESLTLTVKRLEARVEELECHEDVKDLEKAILDNGDKPLVPWEEAKAMLELD
jgi:hypothetical protein